MGIRSLLQWNQVAVGKYVWAIANKKDNLFVKWIHNVYLVKNSWWDYQVNANSSWVWRKIVEVKNQIKEKIDFDKFVKSEYSVQWGVELLTASQREPRVTWSKLVWERVSLPKHRFILWLVCLQRLKTREQLAHFGMQVDQSCLLCGADIENIQHLFFNCVYS